MKKYFVLLLLLAAPVAAQETRYRVSWTPNPPSEQVGWYIFSWFDGKEREWKSFRQTSGSLGENGKLFFEGAIEEFTGSPLSTGTSICIRSVAARDDERSTPSPQTCATVSEATDNTQVDSPDDTLTAPTELIIEFNN